MKSITVNNVNINLHDGPIGVSVSGGADSTILLYILMKYITEPIHIYTCVGKSKNRVAPHIALDVIGKCIDMTGRKNNEIFHHSSFVDNQHITNMFFLPRNHIDTNVVNYVYTATTANPPLEVTNSFQEIEQSVLDERDPTVIKPYYGGFDNKFYVPFRNIDKQTIRGMYEELNVLEELFPMTRSCESVTLTEGHCGECWWCQERLWGFGRMV